ncbi:MAG: HlyD family efflux transporter periplasmic adaptor subunit, partial [Pseudomonadota bacterium]
MSIVPTDLPLVAEVSIENKDIGFVAEGDPVELKFEAFPFTKYGVVEGTLVSIGRSSEQADGQGAVFKAVVSLSTQTMNYQDQSTPFFPGMNVTADIKTGNRRILEFFIAPLLRYRDEAFRER